MKQLLTILVLVGCCMAADECPIAIKGFNPYQVGNGMVVEFTNTTQKTITGTKWQVGYYDAVNDLKIAPTTLDASKKVKPGQKKMVGWDNRIYESGPFAMDLDTSAKIWLVKAAFDDGTTWEENDGKMSCSALSNKAQKKHLH